MSEVDGVPEWAAGAGSDRDPAEVPFAVQIFAAELEVLARGAEAAAAAGAGMIDLNMACPVKKVILNG